MTAADSFLIDYLSGIEGCLRQAPVAQLAQVADLILTAYRQRRLVAIAGNGGSSATASHFACDLGKTILGDHPPSSQSRLRVLALTDNVPLITAWSNDVSYASVFCEQLKTWACPGDVLIVISVSGNSPNVLEALRTARDLGLTTVGFLGCDGGKAKELVDLPVVVPSRHYGQVEDIHVMFTHMVAYYIRNALEREHLARLGAASLRAPKALVLAAGEGSRLRPLTLDRPKVMLPVDGTPLLESTVSWLAGHGIRDIAVNLHYRPDAIVGHLGDGSSWQVKIAYSYENPVLGTAGAIRRLRDFLCDGPFLVIYGDVLTDLDLQELLKAHRSAVALDPSTGITLSLYHVPNPTEVGLVDMDNMGRILRFVEKPSAEEVFTDLASAGVLVMEPHVIDHIPPDTYYDLGYDLFPRLLRSKISMYGWVIPDQTYLLDIGTPEKYAQAQIEWPLRHKPDGHDGMATVTRS